MRCPSFTANVGLVVLVMLDPTRPCLHPSNFLLDGLAVDDLLKKPVPWTGEFFDCGFGPGETYSWPRSIAQAKLRMDENIRRYTGNYVILVAVVYFILL